MSTLLPRRFKKAGSSKAIAPATSDGGLTNEPKSFASSKPFPSSDLPVCGNYSSKDMTLGGGVAIFHLATGRVVLCYHNRDRYHFLPKGRKDMNEPPIRGAEREGYEESGYRNRVLPIPIPHRQPRAHHPDSAGLARFATEAIWVQLVPLNATTQYMLSWYIAETLPAAIEEALNEKEKAMAGAYQEPPRYEEGMTLRQRVTAEPEGYEPLRHEGTGVDEEEAQYSSALYTIEEALEKLGSKSVSADVVWKGWEAIQRRIQIEDGDQKASAPN